MFLIPEKVLDQKIRDLEERISDLLIKNQQESRYLTRKQVALYLNIGLSTVDLWSKLGKLRKIYMDGSVRFDREEIDEILHSKTRRHV